MNGTIHWIKRRITRRLYWALVFRDLVQRYGINSSVRYVRTLWHSRRKANEEIAASYTKLSLSDIKAAKKSDRVFVFGSGYSLNDIPESQWEHIARHDTVGFNAFVYQKWIDVDFHLIRGWGEGASVFADLKYLTDEFKSLVANNRFYSATTFVYQDDLSAQFAHALFEYGALPRAAKVFPYTTNCKDNLPSQNMGRGLIHDVGTLCDAVHFAYAIGWKEIVLVGVDLYDTRYFWLEPHETFILDYHTGKKSIGQVSDRGQRYDEAHSTTRNGIVDTIDRWNKHFQAHGVNISVYNPKSLLNAVLPVYNFGAPTVDNYENCT